VSYYLLEYGVWGRAFDLLQAEVVWVEALAQYVFQPVCDGAQLFPQVLFIGIPRVPDRLLCVHMTPH
jgi:hypothetical protein